MEHRPRAAHPSRPSREPWASPRPRRRGRLAGAALAAALALMAGEAAARIGLELVATGARRPTWAAAAPGDPTRLYVLEQSTGFVRVLELATGTYRVSPFLSIPDVSIGHEAGLLCMAFHPRYPDSAYVYLFYNRGSQFTRVVDRFTVVAGGNAVVAGSRRTVLAVPGPTGFHTGGWLGFGPDGRLYVALGDGGGAPGDVGPGHDPLVGNAQSDTTRHGKILRIDVDRGLPYTVPEDNPFHGAPSPRDEFWATGVRNPWRCAFDPYNGDLFVADVGQSGWEEVSHEPGGGAGGLNLGWRLMQGYSPYNCPAPCDSSGLTRPIHGYDREEGRCAIIGGVVYRGQPLWELTGCYFFADFCSNQMWTMRVIDGVAVQVRDRTAEVTRGAAAGLDRIVSFANDAAGDVYVITQSPDGRIYRVVREEDALAGAPAPPRTPAPRLGPATPNPAAGTLAFRVEAPGAGPVRLTVYDVRGRRVRTLLADERAPLAREVRWDGRDERGAASPAGLYVVRLVSGGRAATLKATLVR